MLPCYILFLQENLQPFKKIKKKPIFLQKTGFECGINSKHLEW